MERGRSGTLHSHHNRLRGSEALRGSLESGTEAFPAMWAKVYTHTHTFTRTRARTHTHTPPNPPSPPRAHQGHRSIWQELAKRLRKARRSGEAARVRLGLVVSGNFLRPVLFPSFLPESRSQPQALIVCR